MENSKRRGFYSKVQRRSTTFLRNNTPPFRMGTMSQGVQAEAEIGIVPASTIDQAFDPAKLGILTNTMIRKLKSGEYRLYSRKKDAKTGRHRNLGTFASREKAEAHERAVQFFKRHG